MEQSFDWDGLLQSINEQRVIPIIGKELITLGFDNREVLLERYIAEQLAKQLDVSPDQLSSNFDLNDVALQFLKMGGREHRIYSSIRRILIEPTQPLPVPEALKKLAAITDFKLYISLTFDSLLKEAINQVRFASEEKTRTLVYSTSRAPDDLHTEPQQLLDPHVYHLFGITSTAKEYAVTDEEVLEYLHTLQSESKQPPLLFDALRDNHLIFIGCGFNNWLERFVIRTITNEPLVSPRSTMEFVADETVRNNQRLSMFLTQYKTEVFLPGNATEFVDTLYTKWMERHPSASSVDVSKPSSAPKMDSGAIFLSYASEDREAALNMKSALEKKGLDVWFDKDNLSAGDAWDSKIQENIKRCSVFLPIISRQAQQRLDGYFRKEWKWAIDRNLAKDDSLKFIQPITIDDIPDQADHIPPDFWSRQASRFPEGGPTPEFVDTLVQLVRNHRLREAGN